MKQPITQQDGFGCGAACLAFIAEISYPQAAVLLGAERARSKGYYCREIVAALSTLGRPYRSLYVKPAKQHLIHTEGTIVFVRRSKRYPAGHYLVRHQDQWMDPWINFQSDQAIEHAESGFRRQLPGQAAYAMTPF